MGPRLANLLPLLLFGSVIALAVILGYLLGGRLKRLERLQLRWWGLVISGLAVQFVPLPEGAGGTDLLVRTSVLGLSYALLLAFALVNVRLPGMPLIVLGLAANATVIMVNGGMPVSEQALRDSGQPDVVGLLVEEGADKHHLLDDDDVLTFLADIIAVPEPVAQVISVGDVFVYAGLIWLTAAAMRGRIPSPTERRRPHGKHRRGAPVAVLPILPAPPPAARRWGSGP
jgi:hypothetical protein